jgi:hypothetical protein
MYRYCTKEDDGLTEGAYYSCTAGYEIYGQHDQAYIKINPSISFQSDLN